MVTNPQAVEPEMPAREQAFREAIGGDKRASVRRIILYAVLLGVLVALGSLASGSLLGILLGVIGALAFVLLLATDQLL